MEKYKKGNMVLEIHQDIDPINPRKEYYTLGVMYCWHHRYILGDEQPKQDLCDFYLQELSDNGHVLNLYLYDHGDLSMSTTPFSDRWDSGQVGFIHMLKAVQIKEGFTDEQALEYLKEEVETYNQYLSGEIYGFELYTLEACETCGHMEKTEGNSCWGFYGHDHKKSGLLDCAGIDSLDDWKEEEDV